MDGPFGLVRQQELENGHEFLLAAGRLEDADGDVGSFVEGRVPEDEPDFVREGGHDLLDDRIERPARLAGRIEELHDGDRGLGRPDDRRVRPYEGFGHAGDRRHGGLAVAS